MISLSGAYYKTYLVILMVLFTLYLQIITKHVWQLGKLKNSVWVLRKYTALAKAELNAFTLCSHSILMNHISIVQTLLQYS